MSGCLCADSEKFLLVSDPFYTTENELRIISGGRPLDLYLSSPSQFPFDLWDNLGLEEVDWKEN